MSKIGGIRIWPQSLYGQILLVAALALLVAQGINASLLLAGSRNRAVAETSTMVVTRIANQIERQDAMDIPIGESDWLQKQRQNGRERPHRRPPPVAITLGEQPVSIKQADLQEDITHRAQEFLRQGEIELSDVRISSVAVELLPHELRDPQLQRWQAARFRKPNQPIPTQAVLFSGRMPDGKWINAAGLVRPSENASIFAMLLQTLTLYIAVMIPLALVVRRVAKPLARLTERVQRVGLTNEIEPMPNKGPADIRQLIDAFNAMQSRVSTLLSEKDVMLGAIGHDLKTPLAALRVRVESVDDNSERDKMAATIDEMVTILDDILMLARLGKSGEVIQSVDIGALAEAITGEFENTTFVTPDTRLVSQIRPVLLRRALRNLIGNAVTYGKTATVSVVEVPGKLIVEIADHGPGIDVSMMEAMFEPFSRAEISRSRATGGSGLGLTIARAIARSHGGDVILENMAAGGLKASLSIAAK
jgi:signal transduction histidine kinase